MATYTEEYDTTLLETPWLAKSDTAGKPYLLKYTRHPSKPGFIVLLTDLTKVHFEPLVGIRLLARQREVEEQHGESQRKKDGGGSSLDMGGEEAVAEVMDGLDGLMGPELEDAELSVASGDLYDLDVVLKSSQSNWVFHMTEIRYGCLEIITRHLVHPLALSITSSKRPKSSTDTQILELVSSKTVLQAINRHSAHPTAPSPKKKRADSPTPAPTAERAESSASGSKSRLVRRRPKTATPEPEPEAETRQEKQRSKSPSPTLRNASSRQDGRKREAQQDASKSDDGHDDNDEMMPEEPVSPASGRHSPSPSPPPRKTAKSPRRRRAPPDKGAPPGSDPPMEGNDNGEPDAEPTPSPAVRPSQKTQQEKDEEEEAELERKREEMKRKMGAGGGGRLVRRRFGR